MENPIIGSLLIIIGAIGYWLVSTMDFKNEFSDSAKFREYAASVMFVILGMYVLLKLFLFGSSRGYTFDMFLGFIDLRYKK
ncbi:hypothetical protein A3SI_16165 [Nitritalea halalkaliphila LW7]|uniref:Uncharacterized protein n=1 Tax=Nitritalea halalkaliphila LW7 TaxID=1189621 RepID=I5BXV8_9BACT|nr:hypothetical protein [Nitritalea halalkaliphila]EIM74410.1 hypothetical protein A3SI_16165 [Nitritalea halalkaliphila LW7]